MLQEYHYAWLSIHPEWDVDSLKTALSWGFDVHHEDGDHSNNDPNNLLLVEHQDHMRLHGGKSLREKMDEYREARLQSKVEKGKSCYMLREQGYTWKLVAKHVYNVEDSQKAMNSAKKYAEYHNRPWPIDVGNCGKNCPRSPGRITNSCGEPVYDDLHR